MSQRRVDSVETSYGWVVAVASMAIMGIGFGAPYVVVVGLKPIAAEFAWPRSIPSLATASAYIGTGLGGIAMGWWADRVGVMWPALLGSLMVGLGLFVASGSNDMWQLYLSHGLLIGLIGNAGTFSPLMSNVTRWFDRRMGVAVALVASGQSIAGAIWPPVFRYSIDLVGWRQTMIWFGLFSVATMAPLSLLLRRRPPVPTMRSVSSDPRHGEPVLGLPANLVLGMLCLAIVGCCVAMAMPMVHTVAYCSDLGYLPARGAEMLSLLLASAFLSRLFWGRLSDQVGGLKTILIGASCQAVALSLYLVVDGEIALYALSAGFGLAFGGIVPAYALAARELFPSSQAGWRIGTIYLFGTIGMALGGWLGGFIYDLTANYRPAFAVGVLFNLLNLALLGLLVARQSRPRLDPAMT